MLIPFIPVYSRAAHRVTREALAASDVYCCARGPIRNVEAETALKLFWELGNIARIVYRRWRWRCGALELNPKRLDCVVAWVPAEFIVRGWDSAGGLTDTGALNDLKALRGIARTLNKRWAGSRWCAKRGKQDSRDGRVVRARELHVGVLRCDSTTRGAPRRLWRRWDRPDAFHVDNLHNLHRGLHPRVQVGKLIA